MKPILAACAVTLLAAPLPAAPITDVFTGFAVLGDSLSDNGNTEALLSQLAPFLPPPAAPAVPPSASDLLAAANFARLRQPGVLSDGETWAGNFTGRFERAGLTGANLAFAGATIVDNGDPVPDLFGQIFAPSFFPLPDGSFGPVYPDGRGGLLARAGGLGARPLVTVFAGGNDLLNAVATLDPAAPDFGAVAGAMAVAQGTLRTALQTLAGAGIADLMVVNLPDAGLIPRFVGAPEPFRARISAIASDYNAALSDFLAGDNLFGARVTEVDFFGGISDAGRLASAGITNTSSACIRSVPLSAQGCEGFLFFDDIHPTATGHRLLSDLARESLRETYPALVPLPVPALMLMTALGGLAAFRRRRAA